jgi:hypothetical protein
VERRKASAPCKARAASQDAADVDLRLSAFRFLYSFLYFPLYLLVLFLGFGETGVANKETEAPPLSFHILPGLRASRGRVLQRSGEEARRENDGCCRKGEALLAGVAA